MFLLFLQVSISCSVLKHTECSVCLGRGYRLGRHRILSLLGSGFIAGESNQVWAGASITTPSTGTYTIIVDFKYGT